MKIPIVGPKIKVVESIYGMTYQNLCKKGRMLMKKDSVQWGFPVSRKAPKIPEIAVFPENGIRDLAGFCPDLLVAQTISKCQFGLS